MHVSLLPAVGLLTHAGVLVIGIGGILRLIPLSRGRRSGIGLTVMALVMALLMEPPSWLPSWTTATLYTAGFGGAFWLVIGPARTAPAKLAASETPQEGVASLKDTVDVQ